MSKSISEKHRELIDFAVQNGLKKDAWKLVEPLKSGLSEAFVYCISVDETYYAIKLDNLANESYSLGRNEAFIHSASDAELMPKVYFMDAARGILLMAYILPQKQPENPVIKIETLVKSIKKLHSMPLMKPWKSVLDVLKSNFDKLPGSYQKHSLIIRCFSKIEENEAILCDENDLRTCHADLNPANILFDGHRYLFVDWEAASPQSFYFDIAYCASFSYEFNDNLCMLFLEKYFDRPPTEEEIDKYNLMRLFTNTYLGIGFLSLSLKSSPDLPLLPEQNILELPTYLDFLKSIGSGEFDLKNSDIQQQFGLIFLRTADNILQSTMAPSTAFSLSS